MDAAETTTGPETPSLEGLNNAETAFELLQSLAEEESPDEATMNAVERLALDTNDEALRAAALQTLASPGFQLKHRQKYPLSASQRELLLRHINQWQQNGLLSKAQAAVLQTRYPNPRLLRRQGGKHPAKAAEKPASLSEILLGETAVKVALYMGAFFVLSAAFIFAAVIESLRLPVLLAVTVLALGVSLGLKRRLPQASFVFAILGTLLIPLDAAVLADLLSLKGNSSNVYWMIAALGMAVIWGGAFWFFHSRFFSILALFAANAAGFYFGRLLPFAGFDLVFTAAPTLAALPVAHVLKSWQNGKFFRPFFITAQVQEITWLSAGSLVLLGELTQRSQASASLWVSLGILFALGAVFYAGSYALQRIFAFPWTAAFVLWPIPLFLLQSFSPSNMLRSLMLLAWGTLLAITGEAALHLKAKSYGRNFSWPLLSVALLALWGAALLQIDKHPGLASLIFGWTAIVYALFSWLKARWPVWTATLLSALGAYATLFLTDWVDALNIPQMWVWFFPAIFLLSVELGLRLRRISKQWRLPLLVLGVLTLLWGLIWALGDPVFEDRYAWQSSFFFTVWAAYGLGYAALSRRAWIIWLANSSFLLSVFMILVALDQSFWLLPLIAPTVLYVVIGWVLSFTPLSKDWAKVFRWSGLLYGTLLALLSPAQGGASSVIAPALIAACWTAEALRRKNVWLGFPTNGLYLLAYFMALITLDIDQPQFYSIGAALLGFLMHYLLRKAEHPAAALLTGVVAQLILFSTTYIQTLLNEQFIYFLALFLQAVIVLVYGVVTRQKSFIITPILFAVLSVITLAFTLFSGIPAMLLVGCVGTLLLTGGVAALALKERKPVASDD